MSARPTLLTIPDELFIKILSSIDFLQLVRSQLVCKRFDHAVRTAGELQYIVELGAGGLVDGLQHPFNTFERINYLKSRRSDWKDPCVEEITAIPPLTQGHLWKLRGATLVRAFNRDPLLQGYFDVVDVVRLDPSSVEQSVSSYCLDSQHTGFEFDPGQDLLVLFNRFPTLPCSSVSFSLLSLKTGTPHPEATNHPLKVPCFGKSMKGQEQPDSLAVLVWGEILVVQLFDGLTKFYFVNWRTGVVTADVFRKGAFARIHNLCRLDRTKFTFIEYDYHSWPQHYTLFVYSLDPHADAPSILDHVATFNFPIMSLRTPPYTFIHSSFPPAPSEHHHIHQMRPNFVSHTSGIVQIRMMFPQTESPSGFQVFVSSDVLLRAGKGQDGNPSVHAWDEWGPSNTRWVKDPLGRWVTTIQPYGYRIGFVDRILDFNPYEVGRDICRGSLANSNNLVSWEGEYDGNITNPKSRIIREPTVIFTSQVFRQNIVSSLPYRETSCPLGNMSQNTVSYVDEDLYFIEERDCDDTHMFYLDYLQHCTQFSGYDGNPTARGLVGILIRQGPAQFRDRIFYRSNEGTGDASMKANFKFSNLCGTVYRQGNIIFTPDGNSVLSPVGNRVSVFDLVNNKSRTLPFENRKNIAAIALSPDSNVLITVDEDGRALLVNFKRGIVLHHFNFHNPVRTIQFSPDGKYIAVTRETHVQVWRTPNHLLREFAPFNLHRTYTGHHDEVLSLEWSPDSKCFITTSRDMTARLFTLEPLEEFRPKTFAGHRDAVVGAYFSSDCRSIYTVSRDGAVFTWREKQNEDQGDTEDEARTASTSRDVGTSIARTRWGVYKRNYFNQHNTKVACSIFHRPSNLLVIGFSTGVFGLWEMPDFVNLHTLSISQEKISSIAINPSGEWLAFGAKKLGQLLVWEWQSESYVLKQQGHYFDMNTVSYSPDGQYIATGGDDGKVKVWNATSGFCFVTFSEHSAAISGVEFAKQGQILFSASLDGTVRAFDLVRYRNFRTFTSPSPVQFSSFAVDPSGEVVVAGSIDSFEIFMWSVQTGKLLDILTGHEGPVGSLSFSPTGNLLASGSWDKSVRLWNVYGRSRAVEPFQFGAEVLALAFRPDGKELAITALDGQVTFYDVDQGRQKSVIEGRKDVSGGRKADDRMTAANNSSGKSYNSLAYTADGQCIIAGGNSKYVVIYDARDGVVIKKFQISENLSLDGTEEFLDSRRLTEAGNLDTLDTRGEDSDLEDRMDVSLPGVQRGDMSKRRYRLEARTKCVRISPTGRAWAAASTEGLLIYSIDDTVTFDPFDLDMDLTPQAVLDTLASRSYLKSLVMAFRLNEKLLIQRVFESIPHSDVKLIARQLPVVYIMALLRFVAEHLEKGPHLEFDLLWVKETLFAHGRYLRDRNGEYASVFRALMKGLVDVQRNVSKLCDDNVSSLSYLIDQSNAEASRTESGADRMDVDKL